MRKLNSIAVSAGVCVESLSHIGVPTATLGISYSELSELLFTLSVTAIDNTTTLVNIMTHDHEKFNKQSNRRETSREDKTLHSFTEVNGSTCLSIVNVTISRNKSPVDIQPDNGTSKLM